jgi:hypothetical protein
MTKKRIEAARCRLLSLHSWQDPVMTSDKPLRRLPLRQLLTSCDKTTREMHEVVNTHFLTRLADCRELTRPVRRRTHYPTMLAVQNGLRRLKEAAERLNSLSTALMEHLDAVRDHGQRERTTRRH